MKIALAGDGGQLAAATSVAASGGIAWLAFVKDLALELFGVPLPVVLAAAAAAYGALSFISATGYLHTLRSGVIWTLIGTYGGQLGLFLLRVSLEWFIKGPVEIPAGGLAGVAMVIAGAGPLLLTLDNVQKARMAVGRLFDRIGGPKP